jgi:putative ABC transport system substrate-binding protein
VVLARDYHDAGIEASQMAVRIMNGEDPAKIPFKPVTRSRLVINPKAAAACNLVIPPAVIKRAEKTIE